MLSEWGDATNCMFVMQWAPRSLCCRLGCRVSACSVLSCVPSWPTHVASRVLLRCCCRTSQNNLEWGLTWHWSHKMDAFNGTVSVVCVCTNWHIHRQTHTLYRPQWGRLKSSLLYVGMYLHSVFAWMRWLQLFSSPERCGSYHLRYAYMRFLSACWAKWMKRSVFTTLWTSCLQHSVDSVFRGESGC